MKGLLFYILLGCLPTFLFSQSQKIDSIKIELKKDTKDTSKANLYNLLAIEYKRKLPDSSFYFSKKALELSMSSEYEFGIAESYLWMGTAALFMSKNDEALTYLQEAKNKFTLLNNANSNSKIKRGLANSYNAIGNYYYSIGDYKDALKSHKEALKMRQELKDEPGIAASYNNLAVSFSLLGNYNESLKNHYASLKTKEKLGNKEGMAVSLNNIGIIYEDQGDYPKALENLNASLKLANELDIKNIRTTCYMNIGTIYVAQKKYKEGEKNLNEAMRIATEMGNKEEMANSMGNLGKLYFNTNQLEKAIKFTSDALELKTELNDKRGISSFNGILGKIYLKQGDTKKSIYYSETALDIGKKTGLLLQIMDASETLAECYEKIGDFKKAFSMQKDYFKFRDSIQSESNKQELLRQELKYGYDKQAIADSLNFANQKTLINLENDVKLKSEKKIRIGLFIGLFIVIIFAVFIFNRFKVTKKQKDIIELQSGRLETAHKLLESKTKELKDSILYAKEIQNAFLKSPDNSKHWFKDTVLLYKPKDVVSGDFYWFKEIDNMIFVAVGDSTGHGVPGAIISVLAIQFFEKTIHLINDNSKLHLLNEYMRNEFNNYNGSNEAVNIGLDYSIVCIDKSKQKIYISGSGENVLVKTKSKELLSHKFENINIGGSLPPNYEPHTAIYELNDLTSLFLYTDGIIDQKGEATKKKLGTKQLKDIILELNTNDSGEAKEFLENKINNWIGKLDQVDDITLLGIQIDS